MKLEWVPRILALAAVIGLCVFWVWAGFFDGFGTGPRVSAWGDVLETRIATVGSRESGHGGYILYRIETHIRYSVSGAVRDRWIPASNTTSDRVSLQIRLLDEPKRCLVGWPPGHEENARCDLPAASN
jgi:hypothetical protein